ncbi:unnamed protein product [Thlaspi arvense]|uniref:Gustatory receptor n=1 Tax=Thlaspi arvense TaxID=13288 RepID=A0AAU9SRS4_THLAR|nr:unnamed protein product [Thlaspi arvense]
MKLADDRFIGPPISKIPQLREQPTRPDPQTAGVASDQILVPETPSLSNRVKTLISWSVFFLLAVIVPLISHFVLTCTDCEFKLNRPYDALVQLSLSIFAGISFLSLSDWFRKYGIRKFLFLDKLKDVSDKVRIGYEAEIQRSTKLLAIFVLPSLTLQAVYRIWWYASGSDQIPYIINPTLSHVLACTLQLSSWLYRTSLFITACIVYQIICHLQILRLDEFARCFASEITDFSSTLAEHLKIRRGLKIVSHRFRRFLLLSLFFVTATQFMALLTTIRASVPFHIYEVGELAILSRRRNVVQSSDDDEEEGGDSDLDKIHPIYARDICFQKRQALGSSDLRSPKYHNSGNRPDPIHKSPESPATKFSFPRLLLWFDQSNRVKTLISWSVFFLLAVIVPLASHFVLTCADCDFKLRRPYDALIQLSLSIFAGISFLSLSDWFRKYGIRKFLFFNKLNDVSEKVRIGYEAEIQRSTRLLAIFVLPSLTLQAIYRIWWYASGSDNIPYIISPTLSHVVACTLQLSSWLYRNSLFIIACIVYQIVCHFHSLRLDDFARRFASEITDFRSTLAEHLRIRRELKVVSHRFRRFILLSLVFVTATQFMALLTTTRASVPFDIYELGELALCSISLVSGVFICLKSATQMTHKAHSVTSIATKWNVCATLNTFDDDLDDGEAPKCPTSRQHSRTLSHRRIAIQSSDDEEEVEGDSDLEYTTIHPIYVRDISSFQKRQALVTYLENNKAGITVYGFLMDKTWLRMIFSIELALLLWLLRKTIVNVA